MRASLFLACWRLLRSMRCDPCSDPCVIMILTSCGRHTQTHAAHACALLSALPTRTELQPRNEQCIAMPPVHHNGAPSLLPTISRSPSLWTTTPMPTCVQLNYTLHHLHLHSTYMQLVQCTCMPVTIQVTVVYLRLQSKQTLSISLSYCTSCCKCQV